MRRIRSIAWCLALCLMLSLFLTACGDKNNDAKEAEIVPTPQNEAAFPAPDASTLVIAIEDEIEDLDVQQISYGNVVHDLITEPLVTYSTDLTELYPAFAESYTLTDGYIEFVLPADAKFSNGSKLDAEAVKASTERFLAISEYAGRSGRRHGR